MHLLGCRNCFDVHASEAVVEVAEVVPVVEEPEPQVTSLGKFGLTAYCACSDCCGIWSDGYTASGAKAVQGVSVAVDPKVIPMGTKLIIDGHEYIAQDTGSSIKGNRIDVYFDSHQEAFDFGVRYKEVFVWKEAA